MTQNGDRFTRAEHLHQSKQRAIEYVELGDLPQAIRSMLSDLNKHSETKNNALAQATTMVLLSDRVDKATVRKWIEGFN
jgi:hypothetical protein